MTEPPAWIDHLYDDLCDEGQKRQEDGEIGWDLEMDYLFRINDDQPDQRGALTGDTYRSTDPDLSFEYIGASYYLALDGEPLEETEHDYGLWFDVIEGKPAVSLDTDLQLWDIDPLYHAVESILTTYDQATIIGDPQTPAENRS
ncbi:MAG: hypothetical protein MUP66_00010 [Candidatus Nanohaloarchaeota archaeon QJJ-5]|nr:hypothetical protein [Candidatus Nanohaloarchaeota archaeon QJJ-5]